MRAITKESVQAFFGGYTLKKSNTTVDFNGRWEMRLFGNLIAYRNSEGTFISNAGWESVTTKERLNGILARVSQERIWQKDFQWYLGDKKWNGSWIKVN